MNLLSDTSVLLSWSHDQTAHRLSNPPSGLCLDTARAPADYVDLVLKPCGDRTGQGWHG
jgi:hypothetical protein